MLLSKKLTKHYRPNMGIMLFNKEGKVWLGRRLAGFDALDPESFTDGFRWQMPQGGIDKGENYKEAAYRELKEETGVYNASLIMVTPGWLAYDFPPEYKKRKWRGQRQKWAVMAFTGDESEIDLTADDHQEFDAWRWEELENLPDLIVPFKKEIYQELVDTILPIRDYILARPPA